MNKFNFCPKCGCKDIVSLDRKWICGKCGFELYNNVASAVGLIIQDSEGKILFEVRKKEPRKGFLAFPGGFTDPGESAEEACFRECREELGVEIKNLRYVGSFPNTYEYNGILYKTCDLFFEAELEDNASMVLQKDEVSDIKKVPVNSIEDVNHIPLAFKSASEILKLWVKSVK